ncbi:hypothetical protein Pelo_19265 [Pelomyxa schiedti]|nr:hypothetical protein Pelo_19265 [Pelomyxa schiedti]
MGDSVSRKMMNAETEDEATVKRALADCIKESSRLVTELEESSKRWYYSSAPASTIKTPVDVSDALCKSEPVQVLVKLLCTPATSTAATTETIGYYAL